MTAPVPSPLAASTRAVRAGIGTDPAFGAVSPPVYLSANYTFAGYDQPRRYDYSRTANPTRDLLAEALAELEGGARAVVTASGLAAVGLCWSLLGPDDLLLVPHDGYGGTFRLMRALASRGRLRAKVVDFRDPAARAAAFAERPALVWLETPSNPLLRVTDIAAVAAEARAVGARVAVDNTFLSPALQSPLALGADLVVHSTTKYLNGHSDVVGGAVVAADPELGAELAWWANATGVTGAPFDAWLTLRGVRTLHARMRAHEENAAHLARSLAEHPAVARVYWPGLPDHPDHALARRQQRGFGGMVSVELRGDVPRFLAGLRCFSLAESLGGVESLVAHPATMTHAAMPAADRAVAGISDALVRLSVGIEDGDDLERDLLRALAAAGP